MKYDIKEESSSEKNLLAVCSMNYEKTAALSQFMTKMRIYMFHSTIFSVQKLVLNEEIPEFCIIHKIRHAISNISAVKGNFQNKIDILY